MGSEAVAAGVSLGRFVPSLGALTPLRRQRADSDQRGVSQTVVYATGTTRIVDGLPFFYLVGFITMLATGARRQRIGDLATKSHVVPSR